MTKAHKPNQSVFPSVCRALIVVGGLLLAGVSAAEVPAVGTLERIRSRGSILLGYGEGAIPFSYLDGNSQPIGFSIDLCRQVTEAVKTALALPELKVFHLATTDASRQVMLESGGIDLHCGNSVNTTQKQRSVAFSVTTYVGTVQALTRKNAAVTSLGDMNGKTIITRAGSAAETIVKSAAERRGVTANFRAGRDDGDALRMLLDGHADAVALNDVNLRRLLISVSPATRDTLALVQENYGFEPYGLEFRRQDASFKRLIDETLVGLMKSGEFARLYHQWLASPIPPVGVNFDLPMSETLKQLLLTPNDRGI